jgi:hypothetical protein
MVEADSNHDYLSSIQTSNAVFKTFDLASISVDELWKLREAIETILAEKIAAGAELENLNIR